MSPNELRPADPVPEVPAPNPLSPAGSTPAFDAVPAPGSGPPALTMSGDLERNLGEQPIARIMREHHLRPHDLVAVSAVEMTHKMVSRACKGRRLTPNTQSKVLAALNRAARKDYSLRDLFTY